MITARIIGGREVAARFDLDNAALRVGLRAVVNSNALRLVTKVRARASGRPGPRAITGDYRRSWSTQMSTAGQSVTAHVGTNAPQGRRLEYGYHGPDILGRTFHQAPLPHVGPAADAQAPEFLAELERFIDGALR